jgi:hypothetical protein
MHTVRSVAVILIDVFGTLAGAGVLVHLFCHTITQWITVSIQHSYDRKLKNLKAENEKALKEFSQTLETQHNLVSAAFLEARRASNERGLDAIQKM